MRKTTGVIRYNLNENGRDFTGQPRKIDNQAAMNLLNGPAVQEAVRKGDIVGYVGHQYREKFGLDVPETVIIDGKEVVLTPAVRTVSIKCYPTGDVEHEQEFLNTPGGRIAERLWDSKAYGFSSAIHAPVVAGVRVPLGYFGMDFVRAPNYDSNRGYGAMLDSAEPGCFSAEGVIVSEAEAADISTAYLEQCALNDQLLETNAKLLERLRLGEGGAMLDSTSATTMERPSVLGGGAAMLDSAKRFLEAAPTLPVFQEPEKPKNDGPKLTDGVKSAMRLAASVISASATAHDR
jgi:hypothetical protein